MGKMSRDEIDRLLAAAEIAVLSTVDADGAPEGSPIWYMYEEGKILIHVGGSSKKARNVRTNPKVSLTVDTRVAPYRGVVLRGHAVIAEPREELRRRMAHHYLGEQMGAAYLAATQAEAAGSVLIEMTIDSVYSWDYSKDF